MGHRDLLVRIYVLAFRLQVRFPDNQQKIENSVSKGKEKEHINKQYIARKHLMLDCVLHLRGFFLRRRGTITLNCSGPLN